MSGFNKNKIFYERGMLGGVESTLTSSESAGIVFF